MKTSVKTLLLFLIVYSNRAAAQIAMITGKSSLNNFIEKTSVEWAAYSNDTATLPAFTAQLLGKFITGKIKGMVPAEQGTTAENNPKWLTPKELENILVPATDSMYGDNQIKQVRRDPATDLPKVFERPVTEFYQILYIENGKLRSYISRVSPKTEVYTSTGLYLGRRESVSFCMNTKYNAVAGKNDRLLSLGKFTKTIYADSLSSYDMLKVLYSKNLIATLWSGIFANQISVFLPNGKDRIIPTKLLSGDYPGADQINVPVYDSTGNPVGNRVIKSELNMQSFVRADITEELWYDETRNIVIYRIPELMLFKKTYTSSGEELVPAFRLVF